MSEVIALDVDLRNLHAWSNKTGKLFYQAPNIEQLLRTVLHSTEKPTIIMEVASAISYQDGDAAKLYQKRRWMIYNMAIAGELSFALPPACVFLVSPSHEWTHGYSEEIRQAIAKADAKNHDLRECQTMLHFHKLAPRKWMPYQKYLDEFL